MPCYEGFSYEIITSKEDKIMGNKGELNVNKQMCATPTRHPDKILRNDPESHQKDLGNILHHSIGVYYKTNVNATLIACHFSLTHSAIV